MKCIMTKWMNKKTKKMDWTDIALVKIGVAGFFLMLAKLWPTILGLEWYWYAIIFILAAIKPCYRFFSS